MIYSLYTSFHTQKKSYKMAFQILNHFYEKGQVKHIINLKQGYSNLAREIHFPAEFSSNPNQTHLSMLINVFRIIRNQK